MLAYGGEELLIEPFAGAIFSMTPGHTAKLSGALHGGSLAGMVLVGLVGTALRRRRLGSLEAWMTGGCVASAAALLAIAAAGMTARVGLLPGLIFALGLANGSYAIAAVAVMMQKVGAGGPDTEGVRMGLWGAAQAVAFGAGGFAATVLSDLARHLMTWQPGAYALVFGAQAAIFLVAARVAARLDRLAPLAPGTTQDAPPGSRMTPSAALGSGR
jgi:BCD family chlorophyll transporter-like MFS transporter